MFRTELNPLPSPFKITYSDSLVTMGSCFAETIGSRLEINKFKVITNPFGVIFNPVSQFRLLEYALFETYPEDYTYIENQGIWYNYDFHSDFSALSREELRLTIEGSIRQISRELKEANWLLLTFGTAIGYFLKDEERLVANCHKIPAAKFRKELISQKQILLAFKKLKDSLNNVNPDLKIIVTVSPVRHVKETLELNSVSKSILRITAHSMTNEHENVSYFPEYELLLDDLRDYRFYAKDMVHPSEVAQEYIWEKFYSSYLDENAKLNMLEWEKVRKSLEHKPFHRKSEAHKKFLESTLKKLDELKDRINVAKEIEDINKQLSK